MCFRDVSVDGNGSVNCSQIETESLALNTAASRNAIVTCDGI